MSSSRLRPLAARSARPRSDRRSVSAAALHSQGESASRRVVCLAAAVAAALQPLHAIAHPVGGQVVAGEVVTTVHGTQMTLDQASRTAIMNWQSFDIAPNELVRILQNSPDAAMLARVTGGNPSELLGRLQADGKVFLINPRGVLVGPGAMIDTAAFLASTLDIADEDFLARGALTFKGDSDAGIVNLGKITAREGNVVLLAHTVKNEGALSAPLGSVGLGAGSEVYLASPDAPNFVIKANLPSAQAGAVGIDNAGVITAAQAQLEAAGGSIYDLAINHSGVVQANGVERLPDGRVLITAAGGNVAVNGSVVARDEDGSGGEILLGGDYRGGNSAIANAKRTYVGASATLDASAQSTVGDGGRVIVWADEATAFLGTIAARAGGRGGDGGFAEASGKQSLAFDGTADLSAPAGTRGELLLDPDNLTIVAGTTALPDALTSAPYAWFAFDDPGDHTLGADSLTALLLNSSVTLQASNTLTVAAPVIVGAGGSDSVTLSLAASTLAINADVSLANVTDGRLHLQHYASGPGTSLTSAANATLAASTLRIGDFPIVALNGRVSTDRLIYTSLQPATSLIASHLDNAIGNLLIVSDEADPQPVTFSGNVSVHSDSAMSVTALIGSANNVTLSSAGDLTLRGTDGFTPATVITASGETKLASTSGVLVNEAGAGLLAGAGRRLLYTSDTTGAFTLGGLTGYAQFDGVSFPDDPQNLVTLVLYNAAGTGPTLTLTITANDFIRLYGQSNPQFTASFSGGSSADLTVQPTFTLLGGPAGNVGTYTIVPSGAASATHAIEYVNGTLTINPATLTYVANPASRLYGDTNPLFGGSVTGFVNGDTLTTATTGVLTFSSPATEGSDAGLAGIFGSGLAANHGNYVFEQALGNFSALDIERAPLTVWLQNATRTYGSIDPSFNATFEGFRNDDTVDDLADFSIGALATVLSPVGEYEIFGGAAAGNYTLNVVPGTLTITPAPVTLQGLAHSSVFGNSPPTLGYQVNGLLNGDGPDVLSGVTFDTMFLRRGYGVSCVLALLLSPAWVVAQPAAQDPSSVHGTAPLAGETVFLGKLRGVITVPDAAQVDEPAPADFDGIDISRTPLLSDPAAAQLISYFLGKPMSFGSADRLCSAVRTWLRTMGQPFVAVYVPPQDVTAGVLRVVVQRARLDGEMSVEGGRWFSEASYREAIALAPGDEIDVARVQSGVQRLNGNAYRRVTVAAEPGSETGTTRLILRAREVRPWEVTAGWNNSGTRVTDEDRATIGFAWGNAFGRGDTLGYNFTADPERDRSRSHSLDYRTAFGSGHSLTAFGSWSEVESALPEPLTQEGTSWQAGLRYGVPLATLSSGWERTLSLGLDFKYSDNSLEFAAIPITDNVTHIVQAGATFSLSRREAQNATWFSTSLYASPGGVTNYNTDEAFDISRYGAKAQYTYARLEAGHRRALARGFSFNVATSLQAASGPLLGTEQLNGGGSAGVRGYRESSAFGDAGALARTELHLPAFSMLGQQDATDLFVFLDGALLDTRRTNTGTATLAAGGLGLNYQLGRNFSLSGAFGWQLRDAPYSAGDDSHYAHFNVIMSL